MYLSIHVVLCIDKIPGYFISAIYLPLPVNSYCFFGDFLQVPESHRHGKLTAGGSSVRVRHRKVASA